MKDTYYFSHDYNARTDEKIKKLFRKLWVEWYWLYWCIIEDLYNNANALQLDYDWLAFDYRTQEETIKSLIEDFWLFVIEEDIFYSKSVWKRLEERESKSAKARESAKARWNKTDANAMQTHTDSNAIKERKGKESKVKYIKEYEDFISTNKNITSVILKTFFALWYKPTESLDDFRKWVQERIINSHNIESLDKFEFIINNFYDYWISQEPSKRKNKIWKTTLTNSFHLKDIRK